MAKSKNHTNHNQNQKAHKNGIKRPSRRRQESQIGVSFHKLGLNPLFLTTPTVLDGLEIRPQSPFLKERQFATRGSLEESSRKQGQQTQDDQVVNWLALEFRMK